MADATIQSSPVWSNVRDFHRYDIKVPQSCGTEAMKVANLRAQIRELEDQMAEVDRIHDRLIFLSKGELISAIVMETSIGFLDLAASLFTSINPQAAKVAKQGAVAVKSVKDVGEYKMGKKNFAQLSANAAKNALGLVDTGKMELAGKVMLNQAKTHVDAARIAINATSGASQSDIRQDAGAFAKDAGLRNLETVGDALGAASKTAKVSKAFSLLDGVYAAANDYNKALESRFDTHLDNTMSARSSMMVQKANLRRVMTLIKDRLKEAMVEFDGCVAGSQKLS